MSKHDGIKIVEILRIWAVSLEKPIENLNEFKMLKSILNFVIRTDDYRALKRPIRCSKCQNYSHLKETCMKCG
jgi:hypothetical protein